MNAPTQNQEAKAGRSIIYVIALLCTLLFNFSNIFVEDSIEIK